MPTPRTPPGEFMSKFDCKVNLIQTTMCSVTHCAAKKLIRIALLCSAHASPPFSLPSLPFWFLCKLIGPPSSWDHPVSNPSLSASSVPRGSPRPDCVYSSALPALSCCLFPDPDIWVSLLLLSSETLHYLYNYHRKMKASLSLGEGEFWRMWWNPQRATLPTQPVKAH